MVAFAGSCPGQNPVAEEGVEEVVEGEVEGVEKKAGNEVGETGCEEWEAGVFVEESIALGRPLYLHSVQKPVKRYRRLD